MADYISPARGPDDTSLHDTPLDTAASSGLKSALARAISRSISAQRLSQAQVEALTGMAQPRVSRIVRGQLSDFSAEKLMRMLICLGHDLDISLTGPGAVPGRLALTENGERAEIPVEDAQTARSAAHEIDARTQAVRARIKDRAEARRARLPVAIRDQVEPCSRDWTHISDADLAALAETHSLRQLSVEFGVSDVAIRKRLTKTGWTSPRARRQPHRTT